MPHVLDDLFTTIDARRQANPDESWTARLLCEGTDKIVRKVGEEAVETVIAALRTDRDALAAESADLLFHLLVLWADQGLCPDEVWSILQKRQGTSGLVEKASRCTA